jgi:hypothetical protein
MKYVSIDIETLGLDYNWSDIIEFGAIIDDLSNPLPLEELPRFHTFIQKEKYKGEPYAMSMHSEILKKIAKKDENFYYTFPTKLGFNFKKFLLKNGYGEDISSGKVTINVAGKNFMGFDNNFLVNQTDFSKHLQVRSRILDPAILYYEKKDETLPSLSLCLERAGLQKEVAHTSLEDALDVIKLIRKKML